VGPASCFACWESRVRPSSAVQWLRLAAICPRRFRIGATLISCRGDPPRASTGGKTGRSNSVRHGNGSAATPPARRLSTFRPSAGNSSLPRNFYGRFRPNIPDPKGQNPAKKKRGTTFLRRVYSTPLAPGGPYSVEKCPATAWSAPLVGFLISLSGYAIGSSGPGPCYLLKWRSLPASATVSARSTSVVFSPTRNWRGRPPGGSCLGRQAWGTSPLGITAANSAITFADFYYLEFPPPILLGLSARSHAYEKQLTAKVLEHLFPQRKRRNVAGAAREQGFKPPD